MLGGDSEKRCQSGRPLLRWSAFDGRVPPSFVPHAAAGAEECSVLSIDSGCRTRWLATILSPIGFARSAVSPFHFQRSFKAVVGVTPRQYLEALRLNKLKEGRVWTEDRSGSRGSGIVQRRAHGYCFRGRPGRRNSWQGRSVTPLGLSC